MIGDSLLFRNVVFLLIFLGIVLGPARAEYLSTDARLNFLIRQQVVSPFPPVSDNPAEASPIGVLNLALAEFANGDWAVGNQRLVPFLQNLLQKGFYKGRTARHHISDPADVDQFHFQTAQFLYRIHRSFGKRNGRNNTPLSEVNDEKIVLVLSNWARSECRLSDAALGVVSQIWGSENHTALRNSSCLAAAEAMVSSGLRSLYDDGSDAESQLNSWTAFAKAWIKEKVKSGGLVEYFSPTYSPYSLMNIHLYFDFSDDPELKRLSRQFLDLWWALWAQEQVDGIHGGSKTRSYAQRIADGMLLPSTVWLYFGMGPVPRGLAPGEAAMAASSYRPPPVVMAIVRASSNHDQFNINNRTPGRMAGTYRGGAISTLDIQRNAVIRRARVTGDFILSTGMVPMLQNDRWLGVSSQNRWSGIVFAGGDRLARIVPSAILPRGEKSYNAQFGVQNEATQLIRGLFHERQRSPRKFGVFFGNPLRRLEQGDWIFVDAAGYAAVRPAFGGWRPDPEDPRWMILNDPRSPVVLQAARKVDFANLSTFIFAVTAMPIEFAERTVSVTGLGGAGKLTLGIDRDSTIEIDGKPVNFEPPFVLKSPFVNQAIGSSKVTVKVDDQLLILDFD
jgi:hypothetical protein